MRSSVARVALAMGVGLASLVVAAEPAAACSCGGGAVPTVDFTGVAVEDLGYSDDGSGTGETRSWLLEVTDARLGVDDGERVEMTMSVGRILYANGDEALMGCGMDDNLIVGASYDVTSVGLEQMNTCGSQVDGPRAEVPVRGEEDDGRLQDLLVIFGGGLVLLLLIGLMVVRPWRDRETFHKRE